MALLQAQGRALEADAANPHQAVALRENQCDEALINRASGETIGEMRAVANALNKVYGHQSTGLALASLGCSAAAAASLFLLGSPAVAAPCLVVGFALAVASDHLQDKTIPNKQLVDTLDRWQHAIEAQQGGPVPPAPPVPQPAPQPPAEQPIPAQ